MLRNLHCTVGIVKPGNTCFHNERCLMRACLDKDVLKAALDAHAAYIGMIGNPSKVNCMVKDMLKERVARVDWVSLES